MKNVTPLLDNFIVTGAVLHIFENYLEVVSDLVEVSLSCFG